MIFDDTRPISGQLVEYGYSRIMAGEWPPGGRIPSTKDLAVQLGVNPRTVMKAYDELSDDGIIYQKRGLGYFTADNARELILENRRKAFVNRTVPALIKTMDELGISPEDLMNIIITHIRK